MKRLALFTLVIALLLTAGGCSDSPVSSGSDEPSGGYKTITVQLNDCTLNGSLSGVNPYHCVDLFDVTPSYIDCMSVDSDQLESIVIRYVIDRDDLFVYAGSNDISVTCIYLD